jgi:hypothetical protein
MTAVCYDGELLAADRMSRVRGLDGGKQIKSLAKEKILTDFDDVVFDGEKVHAVGRSGRVRVSKIMIRQLRRKWDLSVHLDSISNALRKKFTSEEMNDAKPSLRRIADMLQAKASPEELEDLLASLNKVTDMVTGKMSSDEEKPAASLLIVTTNHVHVVKAYSDYRVHWQKEDRSKKVAIGSGKTVALFLMEHLGMNAADAVASMELHHDGCGGGVTFTTRVLSGYSTPLQTLPHNDHGSLTQNLLQASISAAGRRLQNLPA